MIAQTEILTPDGQPFDWAAFHGYDAAPATRCDGWTPDRQRLFLQVVSEGHPVAHACRIVGMSKQTAYALRNSARGAGFALGWQAAVLIARNALVDALMERSLNGVHERVEQDDGRTVTRHRYDNRLAMAMLTRLDKQADAAAREASHAAARLVAQDFEPYLDLIGRNGGPGRAGVFLAARVDAGDAAAAGEDDLAPIRALARADRWLRTHTDLADAPDTSDLDPAARQGWAAEQWLRAEAAGLLVLAPAQPEPDSREGNGQFGQLDEEEAEAPAWWDDIAEAWRTSFPPPPGFDGVERGEYGDDLYSRQLTPEEEEALDASHRARVEVRRVAEAAERDAWFGFAPAPRPAARPVDVEAVSSDLPKRKGTLEAAAAE